MKKNFLFLFLLSGFTCIEAANFTPPFHAEAMAFYFVHDGGPLKLELKVKATGTSRNNPLYLRKNGAFVGRIFDVNEKLAEWDYRKLKSGSESVLSHDFGQDAPAGIYQIRYSGTNIAVTPSAIPEKSFGLMPLRSIIRPTAGNQFSSTWFYVPENAAKLTAFAYGTKAVMRMKDETGALVRNLKNIDLTQHGGEIWQFSITGGTFGFDGTPLILCPDAGTAKRIKGSLETAEDGTRYPHKFQVKIHNWLRKASKADLKIKTVDLRRFIPEMEQDPAARGLIGA